jgi:RNA polymerase sigma-70 factor (ECF subfamily)
MGTMSATPHPAFEELLANAAWARALARSLVRDAGHADDLVQRALVTAIEHPPANVAAPRAWLANVMRNFARQDFRAEERRARRERETARHEAVEPDAVAAQAAVQRELMDAVLALREPYRSTIWARYYDGLAPREIARRHDVPVKTVKTRLARGLLELREHMDRSRGGDRSAWLTALTPLAKRSPILVVASGVVLMNAKLWICGGAAAATLIVLSLSWKHTAATETGAPAHVEAAVVDLARPPETAPPVLGSVPMPERVGVVGETPQAVVETPAAPVRTLHGRVLDLARVPRPGLEIYGRSGPRDDGKSGVSITTSGADGAFEVPARGGRIELAARGKDMVTVFAASNAWGNGDYDYDIYVAPRRALAGRVFDAEHRPLAGATVRFLPADSLRRELGGALDTAMPSDWSTTSDAQGNFALEHAPLTSGTVSAEAVGRRTASIPAPNAPTWTLELVLEPLETKHVIVRGRVVDGHDEPIAGANVSLGAQSLVTDAAGAFAFDLDDRREGGEAIVGEDGVWQSRFKPDALFAVKVGKLPARVALPPVEELARDDQRSFTLVLEGEPRSIRGRVVHSDGTPVPNALLRLTDETPFGMIYRKVGLEGIGVSTTAEALLRGETGGNEVRAKQNGEFEIGGLLEREYRVIALDPRTMSRTTSEPIRAGASDVELKLPPCDRCRHVAGHVLALDGTPIVGASVGIGSPIDDARIPVYPRSVETDEHGAFDFGSVVTDDVTFTVQHSSTFVLLGWKPADQAAVDALEIRVWRKAHVQIDLGTDKTRADAFRVLDENGKAVELVVSRGNMMWMPEKGEIVDGRSEPLVCAENGKFVELLKAGVEVTRIPVRLVPGEITVVRP